MAVIYDKREKIATAADRERFVRDVLFSAQKSRSNTIEACQLLGHTREEAGRIIAGTQPYLDPAHPLNLMDACVKMLQAPEVTPQDAFNLAYLAGKTETVVCGYIFRAEHDFPQPIDMIRDAA